MKILIISYRFHFSGGPERYMFNVMKELQERGHEIVTFSVRNSKNEYSPYQNYFPKNIGNSEEYLFEKFKKNIRFYYDYLTREFYSFYIRKKLRQLIQDTQLDICYLLPHKGALSPSLIDELKKQQIPIIHRLSDYNMICPQAGLYRNRHFCNDCKHSRLNVLKNKCIKNSFSLSLIRYLSSSLHAYLGLYKKIDHFIATNDFAKKQLIEFGYDPEKITTVETFGYASCNPVAKKEISYPVQLLYIGNIDDSKGIYDLLEAVRLLANEYQDYFHLNIYGGLRENEREAVENLIKKYELQQIVVLHSTVPPHQIQDVYTRSDLTVIPARWVENLPNVLIESLFYGVPVVVPDFGSFSAVLDDLVAFFFQPYSVKDLSFVLKQTILNREQIGLKSENCINFAKNRFSVEKHINSLLNIFQQYIRP